MRHPSRPVSLAQLGGRGLSASERTAVRLSGGLIDPSRPVRSALGGGSKRCNSLGIPFDLRNRLIERNGLVARGLCGIIGADRFQLLQLAQKASVLIKIEKCA